MCLHLSVALNFIRSHRSCFIFDTLTFFHIVEVFCWTSPPPVLQQTQLNRETLKVIKSQTGKSNQVDGLLLQPFHVSLHIIITSPTSHLHSGLIVLELHTHTEEGAAWVTSSIDRDTKTPPCWTLAACLWGLGHSEGLAAPCSAFLPQLFLCTLHFSSSLCGHTPPRTLPNKSNTPVSCRWSHRDVLGNRFLLCPSRNLVNPFLGNSAVRSCFISEWTGKKCNYIRSLTSDKKSLSAKHLFPVAEMMQRSSCQSQS